MRRLEVSGAVRPIYESLGVKRLTVGSAVVTICILEYFGFSSFRTQNGGLFMSTYL